ncbi:unnamed protein product [Candida verbasci]|uniref:Proline-rich protein HUA1 n=1 Tax=Candida verbasci TaxID=1227364 RepID=A0A9W4TWL7_9ASCO|nr:unnamed protein product [Candida verbasci]
MDTNSKNDLPPSYSEAINSPPVQPQRPTPSATSSLVPPRPPQAVPSATTDDLYTNNPNLPFKFPKGFLCPKCKNTGYKIKKHNLTGKQCCKSCWDKFYFSKGYAYNPNSNNLSFRYPKGFYCDKCHNSGFKTKNGLSCKDCWDSFSPRNSYNSINHNFSPSYFGSTTFIPAGGQFNGSGPPLRVPPGDPRLGGVLCGKCRGQGMVRFLLDMELCPVCSGLGRVVNVRPSQPQFQQQSFVPPRNYYEKR